MMKKLLILTFAAFLLAMPQQMKAQDIQRTTLEQEQKEIVITVNESNVHIKNADKQLVEIYNMAGVKVASYRIDSPEKTIELGHLQRGCYILKIGKVARKVYLR